jgi:predicted nucleic acid-binding protein
VPELYRPCEPSVYSLTEGSRRDELNQWLAQTIRPMFDQRVLPITEDILFRWRVLMERAARPGIPIHSRISLSRQRRFTTDLPS